MKQGSGHSTHSQGKVEPKPHAINPGGVAQLGIMQGNHVTGEGASVNGAVEAMHKGRGYSAPKAGEDTHHCGSQGRYR
jgi:hypothetical protein